MALDTSDIFSLLRLELDDKELPGNGDSSFSLWSNEELYHYIDDAQREFARDTLCLSDASTFGAVPITADDPWVAFDSRIVELRRVYLNSTGNVVEFMTLNDFERGGNYPGDYGQMKLNSSWKQSSGIPSIIITDMETGKGRLYPIPNADDSLEMLVYREPLEEIEDSSTDLEIDPKFRRALVHGAAMLAYAKDDVETFNKDAISTHLQLWTRAKEEARSFFRKKTRRAPVTTYGGI